MDDSEDNNDLIDESLVKMDSSLYKILKEGAICTICMNLINTPVCCEFCETPSCKNCVENLNKCPTCRKEEFKNGKVSRHLMYILEKITLRCPCCEDTVNLIQFPTHRELCLFYFIDVINVRKRLRILR